MLWLILSLFTALAVSSHDAWVKKFFSDLNPYEMAAYPIFYSIPLFIISLFFIRTPPLDNAFYWFFLANLPLNGVSFVVYMKAIKVSPLSLTVPYLAFTPVFMIATGYLFLDEIPNLWGVLGIMTICFGSYILNLEPGGGSIYAPFKAFISETGSWLMIIVAFLYSIAAVVGKGGILHSSPLFFTMSFFAALNVFLFVLLTLLKKVNLREFSRRPIKGLIAGCLFYLHALFHGYAISLVKAAYMISIKRLSILISVFYGGLIFKESNIKMRFLGAALMLSGAVVIIVKG
jgi:drug/metabolite transporter (DMT)-like permease